VSPPLHEDSDARPGKRWSYFPGQVSIPHYGEARCDAEAGAEDDVAQVVPVLVHARDRDVRRNTVRDERPLARHVPRNDDRAGECRRGMPRREGVAGRTIGTLSAHGDLDRMGQQPGKRLCAQKVAAEHGCSVPTHRASSTVRNRGADAEYGAIPDPCAGIERF